MNRIVRGMTMERIVLTYVYRVLWGMTMERIVLGMDIERIV
jgi:hypothetical protein